MRLRLLTAAGAAALACVTTGCGGDTAVGGASEVTTPTTAAPNDGAGTSPTNPPATLRSDPTPATEPPTLATEPPTPTTEASTSTTPANSGCRRITDFDDASEGWFIVNDGVMGGRSDGNAAFVDGTMLFTGDVVTQGGGFTSVRLILGDDELTGTDRIVMRVRADDRVYGLTMEDASQSGRRAISHRGDLIIEPPIEPDGWSVVALGYDELDPRVFGQPVDADPFDPDLAREIGIIIADGRDGEFALTVDWIDACG